MKNLKSRKGSDRRKKAMHAINKQATDSAVEIDFKQMHEHSLFDPSQRQSSSKEHPLMARSNEHPGKRNSAE